MAAVLAVLLLSRSSGPRLPVPTPPGPNEEQAEAVPFPVASPQDVTIISMDVLDVGRVVGVEPPVDIQNMALASHNDVKLVGPKDPDIRLERWAAPMIVDPQAVAVIDRDQRD